MIFDIRFDPPAAHGIGDPQLEWVMPTGSVPMYPGKNPNDNPFVIMTRREDGKYHAVMEVRADWESIRDR